MQDLINNTSNQPKKNRLTLLIDYILDSYKKMYDDFLNTIKKFNDLTKTNYELALYHYHQGNISDAKFRFKIVLLLDKDNIGAHYNLGRCLLIEGKKDQAEKELLLCLKHQPNFPEVDYILSTISNKYHKLDEIPLTIIEEFFDDLAEDYESEYIVKNEYLAYSLAVDTILPILASKTEPLEVIDIGCGTGLVGTYLKERLKLKNLTGIDLSSKMLSIAKNKTLSELPVYDKLLKSDFHQFLTLPNHKSDLILAVASLHYSPHLEKVLKQCCVNLNAGGIIIFSVEKGNEDEILYSKTMENFTYGRNVLEKIIINAGFESFNITEIMLQKDKPALQCICYAKN